MRYAYIPIDTSPGFMLTSVTPTASDSCLSGINEVATLYESIPTGSLGSGIVSKWNAAGDVIFIGLDQISGDPAALPVLRALHFDDSVYGGGISEYADIATPITSDLVSLVVSNAGNAVIFGTYLTPFIGAYAWNDITGFGSKFSNPSVLPADGYGARGLAITHNDSHVVLVNGHGTASTNIRVYEWDNSTGFGSRISQTTSTSYAKEIVFNSDSTVLFAGLGRTPYIKAFEFDNGTGLLGAAFAAPSVLASATFGDSCTDLKISASGNAIALSISKADSTPTDCISVYKWDDSTGFGTKYDTSSISAYITRSGIGSGIFSVEFSPNEDYIIVSKLVAGGSLAAEPIIYMFEWSYAGGFTGNVKTITLSKGNYAYKLILSPELTSICGLTPPVEGFPLKVNIYDDWKDVESVKVNIYDDWKDVESMKVNIYEEWKDLA